MTFTTGMRLGPYEVLHRIGAGGMGEVYRARDTRLGRDVAIKTLLQIEPERKARLEREARAAAVLNHPNICTLHDVGEHDAVPFLVMELLDGHTLDQRLQSRAMSMEDALVCGIEVARALEHAHAHGIVHRDLKPANIMLTKSGAKVLDFGLAKTIAVAGSIAATATQTQITAEGTIAGTLQYMAPEQLEGRDADSRSDVFAFGAVLYEMLTGRKAFDGTSPASIVSAIMTASPTSIADLLPIAPRALDRAVRKCLARERTQRWQTVTDLCDELQWIRSESGRERPAATAHGRAWWPWITAAAVGLTAAMVLLLFQTMRVAQVARVDIAPPAGYDMVGASPSPNGEWLVMLVTRPNGRRDIWVRSLPSGKMWPVPGSEGTDSAFWSPDSRFVGFYAGGFLKKANVADHAVETVATYPHLATGFAWSPDGTILGGSVNGLFRTVPASGGSVTEHKLPATPKFVTDPEYLPDGRHFLFSAMESSESTRVDVMVGALGGGAPVRVRQADSQAVLLRVPSALPFSSGTWYLLFNQSGRAYAQRFDVTRFAVSGDAIPLEERIARHHWAPYMVLSTSKSGHFLYQPEPEEAPNVGIWERDGTWAGDLGRPGESFSPRISPDGRSLVVGHRESASSQNQDLWRYDFGRRLWTRITTDAGWEGGPAWSPDGRRVVFTRTADTAAVLVQSADGGEAKSLHEAKMLRATTDWSRDGRFALVSEGQYQHFDLTLIPLDGGPHVPFRRTPFIERHGQFHPKYADWIAYTSNESGSDEIYLDSRAGRRLQLSSGGGVQPRWRADGRELYYLGGAGRLMVVGLAINGSNVVAERPRQLFVTPRTRDLSHGFAFDVSPDGGQFVFAYIGRAAESSRVHTLVLNWRPPNK